MKTLTAFAFLFFGFLPAAFAQHHHQHHQPMAFILQMPQQQQMQQQQMVPQQQQMPMQQQQPCIRLSDGYPVFARSAQECQALRQHYQQGQAYPPQVQNYQAQQQYQQPAYPQYPQGNGQVCDSRIYPAGGRLVNGHWVCG